MKGISALLKLKVVHRNIPIDDELFDCLKRIVSECKKHKTKKEIDGIPVSSFLFRTTQKNPTNPMTWGYRFKTVCEAYNKTHEKKLPNITPHIARHTYCTKLMRKNVPLKITQYLMGYSNSQVTLDIYSHVTYEDVVREFQKTG